LDKKGKVVGPRFFRRDREEEMANPLLSKTLKRVKGVLLGTRRPDLQGIETIGFRRPPRGEKGRRKGCYFSGREPAARKRLKEKRIQNGHSGREQPVGTPAKLLGGERE